MHARSIIFILCLHAVYGGGSAAFGHSYGAGLPFLFFDGALDHLLEVLLDLVLREEVLCLTR